MGKLDKKRIEKFESILDDNTKMTFGKTIMDTVSRESLIFPSGTFVFDTDESLWYYGDGSTSGGLPINSDLPIDINDVGFPSSEEIVWKDDKYPATRIRRGSLNKPDFDYTNIGLLFPQNNTSEIVYIIAQINHDYKLESEIRPHIHFVQDSASQPVFKMDYRWYKNGDDPTGSFTTLTASSFAFTYTSGSILQIVSFPAIDGTGIDTVSSILDIKLYRDDNVVTGDVLVKEFDIHYQIDTLGSLQEFVKTSA